MAAPSSDTAGIRQVIRALRAAGHTLIEVEHVWGETIKVSTETEAVDAITAADMAHLFVRLPDGVGTGYVLFVLGNDPEEVAADWTVNLDPTVDDLTTSWWS